MKRKREVEEVFRIEEEILNRRNPITKEPIKIKREIFSCGEISFISTYEEVERYLNLANHLSAEEMYILYRVLSSIEIEDIEDEDRYILKKIKHWIKTNNMTLARFVYSVNFLVDIFYITIEDIAVDILDLKEYRIYEKIMGYVEV